MRQKLELLSSIVMIVVGAVWLYIIGSRYLFPPVYGINPIKVGEPLTKVKEIDWSRHDRTLVLALRVGCRFCEDSMPFYNRLATMRNAGQPNAEIVAAFPEDTTTVREYTNSLGLTVESFANIPLKKLNAPATPTLILVDRNGRVIKSWLGKLTADREREVIDAIEAHAVETPTPVTGAGAVQK